MAGEDLKDGVDQIEDEETTEEETPEGDTEETDEEESGDDESEEEEAKPDTSKDEEEDDSDKPVPTRKTAKDFINERRSKRLAKVEKEAEADEEDEEDDEEVDPKDRKSVNRIVRKTLAPIVQTLVSKEDEAEIKSFLADHPEMKKYEGTVRKWMEVHSSMPIPSLFYAVRGEKGGVSTTKTKAKEDAIPSTSGGRAPAKTPDYDKMSPEEFDAEVFKVKTGQK